MSTDLLMRARRQFSPRDQLEGFVSAHQCHPFPISRLIWVILPISFKYLEAASSPTVRINGSRRRGAMGLQRRNDEEAPDDPHEG